jgi:Tfp pilus assembly protein FimT
MNGSWPTWPRRAVCRMITNLFRPRTPRRSSLGTTLLELCVVLCLMAALSIIALPRLHDAMDRAAARGAIQEASSLFSLARRSAVTRRAVVAVMIDTAEGAILVRAGSRVIGQGGLRRQFGVRVATTRDSMAYDPRGLGYGAANLSVIARRGGAAETLTVSRLGRTRH